MRIVNLLQRPHHIGVSDTAKHWFRSNLTARIQYLIVNNETNIDNFTIGYLKSLVLVG